MLNFLKHHWTKREKLLARWTVQHLVAAIVVGVVAAIAIVSWQTKNDSARTADLRTMAAMVQQVSQSPPGTKGIGGPFTLVNQDGKTVTDADYRGKFMLVYFGYAYCPDMCPTGLQSISNVLNQLGGAANNVVPVFITVDPVRDTPEKLKLYVNQFDARIQALTGSTAQVEQAAKAYQVYYAKGEQVDEQDYVMDHSTLIYLMAPDGSFIATYPESAPTDTLAKAVLEQMDKFKTP